MRVRVRVEGGGESEVECRKRIAREAVQACTHHLRHHVKVLRHDHQIEHLLRVDALHCDGLGLGLGLGLGFG